MFFKIEDTNFSHIIAKLNIEKQHSYKSQTSAGGNTTVDYVNSKRQIEIEVISLDDVAMAQLLGYLDLFSLKISFLNPKTNVLEEGVQVIIPTNKVEYYTIQGGNNVRFNAMNIKFQEL